MDTIYDEVGILADEYFSFGSWKLVVHPVNGLIQNGCYLIFFS